VLDPGTFVCWDAPIDLTGHDEEYINELTAASTRAGTDEAVVTGRGMLHGHAVAVIVSEFEFLAGSIGRATARRIVDAVHRATREGLPLLAAPCSGGTRMQEGTPAFVQMVSISRAVVQHKAAGLPYLVYLRHPTTGGVLASWGSLGHVTIAEPGALVGFLGPRVVEALTGRSIPAGVQVSENLANHGVIDAVVAPDNLGGVAARVLHVLAARGSHTEPSRGTRPRSPEPRHTPTAWEAVRATRRPDRPGVRELLRSAADDVIPLNGTGCGERASAMVVALASFHGTSCLLVGQDRRTQAATPLDPAALRQARRGIRLADELGLPLVTVIDTPGAALSAEAEQGALAGEIARCLADLESLSVPRVSILLGEGCGGAALALLPADRVIAAESAWLAPLPPEGASAIVHRDLTHAPEMAERQRIRAVDLKAEGIVDILVPEEPPGAADPRCLARAVAEACVDQLHQLRVPAPRTPGVGPRVNGGRRSTPSRRDAPVDTGSVSLPR
jgi:acetyl-CoA carboxylase beta subunit/acetyl-CoA carboxylase alpha subunit